MSRLLRGTRLLTGKDLRILRRSPLLCGLLVVYPIVLGVLIGLALQSDSSKPRVAYVNEVPKGEGLILSADDEEFGDDEARAQLCARVECVDADSREEAERMVADGEVLGALILPADLVDQLESLAGLNPETPTVDVIVNEDDPLKASLVDDRIEALLADANFVLSQRLSEQAALYLDLLIEGGDFSVPLLGEGFSILGLDRSADILEQVERSLPAGDPAREQLSEVSDFARVAGENVDLALPLLGSLVEPIGVNKISVSGDVASLDSFAIAVAVAITLMFVAALLTAGSLALERDDNALDRVVATVGAWTLIAAKLALGIIAATVVSLIALVALTPFLPIAWERLALIAAALIAAGAACSAFGAMLAGAARDLRTASLLAVLTTLPIAFLSLVPSGSVADGLYDVIQVVRALFPFDASLRALTWALDPAGDGAGLAFAQLAVLTAVYLTAARLGLRRLPR